jgi:hypothetical protein
MSEIEDHKDATQRSPFEFKEKKKFNRRIFRKYIKAALGPILGSDYENWGGGNWRYCTTIGQWKVITWTDTGGKFHQVSYDHAIQVSKTQRLFEGGLSIIRWYGIANSNTDWNDLKDEDAEQVAESLAKIIKHFLDAAPKLLEGLTLD